MNKLRFEQAYDVVDFVDEFAMRPSYYPETGNSGFSQNVVFTTERKHMLPDHKWVKVEVDEELEAKISEALAKEPGVNVQNTAVIVAQMRVDCGVDDIVKKYLPKDSTNWRKAAAYDQMKGGLKARMEFYDDAVKIA